MGRKQIGIDRDQCRRLAADGDRQQLHRPGAVEELSGHGRQGGPPVRRVLLHGAWLGRRERIRLRRQTEWLASRRE